MRIIKYFREPSHIMSIIPSTLTNNFFGSAYTNSQNHILRPVELVGSENRNTKKSLLGLIDSSRGFKIILPKTDKYYQIDLYRCNNMIFDRNKMELVYTSINSGNPTTFCFSSDGTVKNILHVPRGMYWPIIRFCGNIDIPAKNWLRDIYASVGHASNTSIKTYMDDIIKETKQQNIRQISNTEPSNPLVRRYVYEIRAKNERISLNKECEDFFDRARSIMIYDSGGRNIRTTRIGEIINVVEIVYGKNVYEEHTDIEIDS